MPHTATAEFMLSDSLSIWYTQKNFDSRFNTRKEDEKNVRAVVSMYRDGRFIKENLMQIHG